MKEKTLIKICLLSVIVGIIIMFFANRMITPKEIKISDVSEEYNYVKIKGEVVKIYVSESGTAFIELSDESGSVDVVVFKGSIENVSNITTGDFIEVIGKPEKYKGEMEVIASSIIR